MRVLHQHPKQKDDNQRIESLIRLYRACISLLRRA